MHVSIPVSLSMLSNVAVAAEHGLSELRYVLYPKPAGFSVCLDQLLLPDGGHKAAVVVHDITIAYRDFRTGSRTVEASIVKGIGYPVMRCPIFMM